MSHCLEISPVLTQLPCYLTQKYKAGIQQDMCTHKWTGCRWADTLLAMMTAQVTYWSLYTSNNNWILVIDKEFPQERLYDSSHTCHWQNYSVQPSFPQMIINTWCMFTMCIKMYSWCKFSRRNTWWSQHFIIWGKSWAMI